MSMGQRDKQDEESSEDDDRDMKPGDRYYGEFRDGLRQGSAVFVSASGNRTFETWRQESWWHECGRVSAVPFDSGNPEHVRVLSMAKRAAVSHAIICCFLALILD